MQHNRIHCWIGKDLLSKLGNVLNDGKMYHVHNFLVKPYTGSNRCFDMDHHVVLSSETIISEVHDPYMMIPADVYIFANLKNITQLGRDNAALIGTLFILRGLDFKYELSYEFHQQIESLLAPFLHTYVCFLKMLLGSCYQLNQRALLPLII